MAGHSRTLGCARIAHRRCRRPLPYRLMGPTRRTTHILAALHRAFERCGDDPTVSLQAGSLHGPSAFMIPSPTFQCTIRKTWKSPRISGPQPGREPDVAIGQATTSNYSRSGATFSRLATSYAAYMGVSRPNPMDQLGRVLSGTRRTGDHRRHADYLYLSDQRRKLGGGTSVAARCPMRSRSRILYVFRLAGRICSDVFAGIPNESNRYRTTLAGNCVCLPQQADCAVKDLSGVLSEGRGGR